MGKQKNRLSAKDMAAQMGMSKRWIEQVRRVNKYPELAKMVQSREISLNKADAIIRAREQGKDHITLYAKIPLDDPDKASSILFNALRKQRTSTEFIQALAKKLLSVED